MSVEISIIVPFYETPIEQFRCCIDSLLSQKYQDFELLLIDDGNSEEYFRIVQNLYLGRNDKIKFIRQSNKGVSSARNIGIDNSEGRYIVFCDSDDFVEQDYLSLLYNEIKFCDLAMCGVTEQYFPVVNCKVDVKDFVSNPSQYNYIQYTNFVWNKIFKADIIRSQSIRFKENIKLGEDAIFTSEYLKYVSRIHCIENMLYHYRLNENSATKRYFSNFWDFEKVVVLTQFNMFTQYDLSSKNIDFIHFWLFQKFKQLITYYINYEKDSVCLNMFV